MAFLLDNPAQGMLSNQIHVIVPSLITGITFHSIVARPDVEFEHYTLLVVGVAGCATGLDFVFSITTRHFSVPIAITRICLAWSGFLVGLISSLIFYRLFLHRCRTFPGPFAARLTRFYAAYLNAQEEQFYRKLGKLHETCGDYMRIGPRELSLLDPAAIPLLYGPKSTCTKGTFYAMNGGGTDDTISINGVRNPAKYRPRRRAWDRGLSMKALATYQPRIEAQAIELVRQIHLQASQPIDISTWSMFFGFDVMGDVGFSRDFGNMRTGSEHPAIRAMHSFLWMLGVVQTIPWLPRMMNKMPGATKGVAEFYDLCAEVLEEKQRIFDNEKEPRDMISWLLKAGYDKDGSASPTPESLADDNRGMIIAGSDTSSNTLANALFYLAKHQHIQSKLRTQLQMAKERDSTSWNYSNIKSVTYLDDIINETLRLKPPIIQGVPRETPAGGLRIGERYIPGHVAASVPTILIQRDPRWWQDADEFIPERWTEKKKEMNTNPGLWIPFGLGMHACAGKNLGYMMLRTAISMLIENFDIAFAEGETGERFDGEFLSSFMMVLRPLRLIFKPRTC